MKKQRFTSKNTSINKNKVPALFGKFKGWKNGATNYDCGGGKYDTATEFLKAYGVTNHIVDKFNRSETWNAEHNVICDTATCSNVLNVIAEKSIRLEVIKECFDHCKECTAFYIYEGDKSGIGKQTSEDCWQNNLKTVEYISEIAEIFSREKIKKSGQMIIAYK